MKIGGFSPFTLSDYPGHPAAIIFTIGCNFRCPYCHNRQLWSKNAQPKDEKGIITYLTEKQGRLNGVVITGGEPTLQDDLEAFIKKIKKLNYQIKLDTNGTHPAILKRLIDNQLIDYIAMDIKAPFHLYKQLAGTDQLSIRDIKESINIILESQIDHLFRTTWDKSLLSEKNIEEISSLLPVSTKHIIQKCRQSF